MSPLKVSHRHQTKNYSDPIKVLVAVLALITVAVMLILFANGISLA